ncbi:MAG TPA: acyltransferase [Acetobacteraceae bacterium]|nr:acyltransferase [Acetobacteraceae bacterium]
MPGRGYILSLDGLRAVSILLVLFSHVGFGAIVPGAFGVTLFFFISGYLITGQLAAEIAASGRVSLRAFYLRRALRLLPAGLAYILVSGLVFMAAGGWISRGGWAAALAYGANYYDIWIGYRSDLAGIRHPFNILWSLAVEEHFYLLWPVALLALSRWRGPGDGGARGWAGAMLAVGGLCLLVPLWRAGLHHACAAGPDWALCGVPGTDGAPFRFNRLYQASDTRIDSIAWGALAALLACVRPEGRERGGPGGIALALVLLAVAFAVPGAWFREVARTSVQGAALAILVPAIIGADTQLRRALERPAAILLGRASYSLYLWHWAALAIADALAPGKGPVWLALGLGLSAAFTVASYRGIERPMLRWRRLAGAHVAEASGAAATEAGRLGLVGTL